MSWFKKKVVSRPEHNNIATSALYNEETFYNAFVDDVSKAKHEVIIECPYLTRRRLNMLKPVFEKLVDDNISLFIITRDPREHEHTMAESSEEGIRYFETIGVQVLLIKGGHHRKLAIIDRKILWEGSLNILSQNQSREFMRRIESSSMAEELFQFLRFDTIDVFKKEVNLL